MHTLVLAQWSRTGQLPFLTHENSINLPNDSSQVLRACPYGLANHSHN